MEKFRLFTLFFLSITLLATTTLKAQLRVDSNGDTTVKYGNFSTNHDAVLYLGDSNHYIKSIFGYGVCIGTLGGNIIRIPQYAHKVGIDREPSYTLDVNGVIRADVTTYSSDERLKRNIKDLTSPFDGLKKIQGVSYTFTPQKDSLCAKYDKDGQVKRHFGFIAQDFEKVFPDLVYKDSLGYLSIDYISVIPVLVEAIKQQQQTIENLQSQVESCCQQTQLKSTTVGNGSDPDLEGSVAKLYQNAPNPFSTQTIIKFEIPESVSKAQLYICNMNGTLLKNIAINQRGSGNITINANEFNAGMYLYSLVDDGKIIDTKQMLLTE